MRKQGTKDLDFIKVQIVSVVHLDEDKPPCPWRASDVDDLAITPRSWEGAQQLPSLEHCVGSVLEYRRHNIFDFALAVFNYHGGKT